MSNNIYDSIKTISLIKLILFKLFCSEVSSVFFNVILPILLPIYLLNYTNTFKWNFLLYVTILLIVIFNIIACSVKAINKKKSRHLNLIDKSFEKHSFINSSMANNMYRLNKKINDSLSENIQINKTSFNNIADFQSLAFLICGSIYELISTELNCNECQITVFRRFNNKIKMIAYMNKGKLVPSTYHMSYDVTGKTKNILFIQAFKDLNAAPIILCNKEEIKKRFKILQESRTREEKICQYVGIPIKTNRKKIELLLQVDVSSKNILGKNSKEVELFSENILQPYATLLHKSYERDLIFNKLYDILETTNISQLNQGVN